MEAQPSGTVTLVFTDIEGSTRLLSELGKERYREALAEHRERIRGAFGRHDGYEVDYEGDSFFYAFQSATAAVAAVREGMAALADGPIRVRVGIHTGEPGLDPPKYVGLDVHRAARIMACAHGGQAVLSQATRELLEDADGLHDLGEHRLKDLSAPVRLYQLGGGEFPPLRSLYRTNLPVPATSFLGRAPELAEIGALLEKEDTRLLVLTGPGGTGKTRLALQAAAEGADRYPDGVWWVQLAPLRDPELLLPAVAQALDVKEQPGQELAETLADRLAGKRTLLLLDNVEHLLPEAATAIASLRNIAGLQLLATSRERLQLAGEQLYPVPSLADSDAATLFTARARQLDPAFASSPAVTTLCTRLDNLPLALELAAARTSLFSAEELLGRLSERLDLLKAGRDSDPRQQTLRATIDWSYELLDADEQHVYRALGSFVGGCTLEAALEVCGTDADHLQSLLDKNLLRRRESDAGSRYWMLETIRQHAEELLGTAPDAEAVRRRHTAYFLAIANEMHEAFGASSLIDRATRARFVERENLLRLLDELERVQRYAEAVPVLTVLRWLMIEEFQLSSARMLVDRGLAWPPPELADRARLLRQRGHALAMEGDGEKATADLQESVQLERQLKSQRGLANALHMLGFVSVEYEDYATAAEALDEAAQLWGRLGVSGGEIEARGMRTAALAELGRDAEALADIESLLASTAEGGHNLGNLGEALLVLGKAGRAADLLRQSILAAAAADAPAFVLDSGIEPLAAAESALAHHDRAAWLLGFIEAKRSELQLPRRLPQERWRARAEAEASAALGPAYEEVSRQGAGASLDDALAAIAAWQSAAAAT